MIGLNTTSDHEITIGELMLSKRTQSLLANYLDYKYDENMFFALRKVHGRRYTKHTLHTTYVNVSVKDFAKHFIVSEFIEQIKGVGEQTAKEVLEQLYFYGFLNDE